MLISIHGVIASSGGGAAAATFEQVGNGLSVTTDSPVLAGLNTTDIAYVEETADELRYYSFNGTNWSQSGASFSLGVSLASSVMCGLNSTDVAYIDRIDRQLKTYQWGGAAWSQVGNALTLAAFSTRSALAGMTATRVAFIEPVGDLLYTYDWSGTDWSQTGNTLSVTGTGQIALTSLNSSRVAFVDSGAQELRAYDFDGTNWSLTGSAFSLGAIGTPSLAQLNNHELVLTDDSTQTLRVFKFDGTTFTELGTSTSTGGTGLASITGLKSDEIAWSAAGTDEIRTYNFTESTAWDVDTATYDTVSFSLATQDSNSRGASFSDDGTKMYGCGALNSSIYQYTLTTPWDINSASYASKSANVSTQDAQPVAARFKPDGLKMYVMGKNTDTVYQYTLGTAWDVGTATFDTGKTKAVGTEEATPEDVIFSPDGTKMYVVGSTDYTVYQYTLGTAWDVSTASYDTKSFDVSVEESVRGIFFKDDGLTFVGTGILNDGVYQYSLGTAWDISTAFYAGKFVDIGTEAVQPTDVSIAADGTKLHAFNLFNNTVYQYSLP